MNLSIENSPVLHTRRIKVQLHQLIEQLHEAIGHIREPKAQAIFEASAEVLTGLVRTLNGYERNCEEAWRTEPSVFRQKEEAIQTPSGQIQ